LKKFSACLLIAVVLFLVWGCSKKTSLPAERQLKADHPEKIESDEQVKAATPEDPGPIATVVTPLAILKGPAKPVPTKLEAEELTREPQPTDHPVYLHSEKSKKLLHSVFSVNKYAQFVFVIPPHQGYARLHGDFRSFTKRGDLDSTSDKTADVDLMLLNEQEFNDFQHGRLSSATYEIDPAHNQMVDWGIPSSYDQPQQYHLVFSNSDGGPRTKFVKADFTVTF
jgi:hypothetical protein